MALASTITEFSGSATDPEAQTWLDRFDRFCLDRNIDDSSTRKARYFKTFMTGSARDWFNTLSPEVRGDFDRIEKAFLDHFAGIIKPKETPATRYQAFAEALKTKKTVEDLRDGKAWRLWLAETLALAINVDNSFASDELKASNFWSAIPVELKVYLGTMPNKVIDAVNACRDLPPTVYDDVIEQYDSRRLQIDNLSSRIGDQPGARTQKFLILTQPCDAKSDQTSRCVQSGSW